MSEQPDLSPDGAIWVCLACGAHAKSREALKWCGCRLNVALCHDDKPKGMHGDKHGWRLYEPRG